MADEKKQDFDMEGARPLQALDEKELADLNRKIIDARKKMDDSPTSTKPSPKKDSGDETTAQGMRIASEIIASPVAGGILGYLIDMLFGTHPAALIIMIVLGIVAGFYRAYKLSQ